MGAINYPEELEQLYKFIDEHTGINEGKRWKRLIKDVIIPEIEKSYGRTLAKMSHQRRWQILSSAMGLCQKCRKTATHGVLCDFHYKKQVEYRSWRERRQPAIVREDETDNEAID